MAPQSMARSHYCQHVDRKEQTTVEALISFRDGGEVHIPSLQPHRQAKSAVLRESDLDAWMAPPILLEERHHHALNQLWHRAYPEHPDLTGLEGARALADRLGVDQEPSAPLE